MLDLESNKISISRHIVFHESIFPFAKIPLNQSQNNFFHDRVPSLPIAESLQISQPSSSVTQEQHLITSSSPKESQRHQVTFLNITFMQQPQIIMTLPLVAYLHTSIHFLTMSMSQTL